MREIDTSGEAEQETLRQALWREAWLTLRCICFWGGWLLAVVSLRNILLENLP